VHSALLGIARVPAGRYAPVRDTDARCGRAHAMPGVAAGLQVRSADNLRLPLSYPSVLALPATMDAWFIPGRERNNPSNNTRFSARARRSHAKLSRDDFKKKSLEILR
jgi:hypothetical protein